MIFFSIKINQYIQRTSQLKHYHKHKYMNDPYKSNHFKSTSYYKRIELPQQEKQVCDTDGISKKITKFFGQLIPSKQYNEKSFATINNGTRSCSNSIKVQIPKHYENDECKNDNKKISEYQQFNILTAPTQKQYYSNSKQNKKKSAINSFSNKSKLKTQSHLTSHNLTYNPKSYQNKQNSLSKIPQDLKRRLLFQSTYKKNQQTQLKQQKNHTQIKNFHNTTKLKTKTESDNYAYETRDSLSLKKLRLDMQRIKNLQSYQSKKSNNTSKSKEKKGMTCTLYEKSLQKNSLNISRNDIKSQLKQAQTRPSEGQMDLNNRFLSFQEPSQFDSKIIKRIKLKKKQKQISQSKNSNLSKNSKDSKKNCFQSIKIIQVIGKSKQCSSKLQNQISSIQKIQKKLHQSKEKSLQKRNLKSIQSIQNSLSTIQKVSNEPTMTKQISLNFQIQQKFARAMQKIKSYKFISAYFTDLQLQGLLNQYQKAGEQQCKWPLLVIDQVYQKIKHVDQSKLKGIQHSREYYFQ